jgi:LPXTG-site transpeptidase (sortase) family protein
VVGCLSLGYGAAVYFWKDPVTDLWAAWKQRGLATQLEESFAEFKATPPVQLAPPPAQAATADPATPSAQQEPSAQPEPAAEPSPPPAAPDAAASFEAIAADADRYKAGIAEGDALGRLVIPELGIDPVVVNGTDWGRDLSRGPGLYPESKLPGLGHVTAIAGHRTTFGAWFRNVDELRAGDAISLVLPYGTFRYTVVEHEIVDNGDWSILDPRPYDTLVLSACHPLYSASQRWIVYARLVSVDRPDGTTVRVEPQRT